MTDKQTTFEDLSAIQYVRSLTATQIDIIRFLEMGDYQAQIARRLRKSRSYVCQVVRRLESHNLIIPRRISFTHKGKTRTVATTDPLQGRATGYVITPQLKTLLAQTPNPDGSYTLCIPHHLKIKIPILDQNQPITKTGWRQSRSRSIHIKSWRPRGPERHLFHVEIVGGTIGVEYHGSSLVAYRVNRTHLLASDVNEATVLAAAQIQDGVTRFVEEQGWSGTRLTLGTPQVIDRPHFAFPSKGAKQVINAGHRLTSPGLYCDDSLTRHGVPDLAEIETTDPVLADQIDRGLRNALNIEPLIEQTVANSMTEQNKAILSGFCQNLEPIQKTLGSIYTTTNTVLAHVMGGTTLEHQFSQIVTLLTHTLNEMQGLKNRIEELEQDSNRTVQHESTNGRSTLTQASPPAFTGRTDQRISPGRQQQSMSQMRTGIPRPPSQEVSGHPPDAQTGPDPVYLHGLHQQPPSRRPKKGTKAGNKKKKGV